MTPEELKEARLRAGLSQAQFGREIGKSRDYVGAMERGAAPINRSTIHAVRVLEFVRAFGMDLPEGAEYPRTSDPMERSIEVALINAGIRYETDHGGENPSGLDFRLPDYGVEIEVKRFHSDRIAAQMARAPNVIAVQGEEAIGLVADMFRALGAAQKLGAALRAPTQEKGGPA